MGQIKRDVKTGKWMVEGSDAEFDSYALAVLAKNASLKAKQEAPPPDDTPPVDPPEKTESTEETTKDEEPEEPVKEDVPEKEPEEIPEQAEEETTAEKMRNLTLQKAREAKRLKTEAVANTEEHVDEEVTEKDKLPPASASE